MHHGNLYLHVTAPAAENALASFILGKGCGNGNFTPENAACLPPFSFEFQRQPSPSSSKEPRILHPPQSRGIAPA